MGRSRGSCDFWGFFAMAKMTAKAAGILKSDTGGWTLQYEANRGSGRRGL